MKYAERALVVSMILCAAFIIMVIAVPESKPKGLDPIVRLNQGNQTFCTGTVINDTTIVTAAHCVLMEFFGMVMARPEIEIRPKSNLNIMVIAHPTYITTQLDMAILKGDFHLFQPKGYTSTINKLMELQKPGKEFMSCGYPLGGDLQCTKTIYIQRDNFSIRVHGLLLPGMSGGPTMDSDGNVIAINNAVDGQDSIVTPIYNIDFNMAELPKEENK